MIALREAAQKLFRRGDVFFRRRSLSSATLLIQNTWYFHVFSTYLISVHHPKHRLQTSTKTQEELPNPFFFSDMFLTNVSTIPAPVLPAQCECRELAPGNGAGNHGGVSLVEQPPANQFGHGSEFVQSHPRQLGRLCCTPGRKTQLAIQGMEQTEKLGKSNMTDRIISELSILD